MTGDPWDGRSLEWATASPPPVFNFAVLPDVDRRRGLLGHQAARARAAHAARRAASTRTSRCRATAPTGFICAFFADDHGLRADLAHLVAGRSSASSAPSRPSSCFAWRDEHEDTDPGGRRSPASTAPTASRAATRSPSAAGAPHEHRRHACPAGTVGRSMATRGVGDARARRRSASSSATASGSSCSATSSCSPRSSRPTRC